MLNVKLGDTVVSYCCIQFVMSVGQTYSTNQLFIILFINQCRPDTLVVFLGFLYTLYQLFPAGSSQFLPSLPTHPVLFCIFILGAGGRSLFATNTFACLVCLYCFCLAINFHTQRKDESVMVCLLLGRRIGYALNSTTGLILFYHISKESYFNLMSINPIKNPISDLRPKFQPLITELGGQKWDPVQS